MTRDAVDLTDLCVIGGGAAGRAVALGAALLGVPVTLIDHGIREGTDHDGTVLLRVLQEAAAIRAAGAAASRLGLPTMKGEIDLSALRNEFAVRLAGFQPAQSSQRLAALGVRVVSGRARFVDRRVVEVGAVRVRARRFVIATGSAPTMPEWPGLARVPVLTPEKIADLTVLPRALVVVGGGPLAAECAQIYRRLGAEVALVVEGRLLPEEDGEAADIIGAALEREGVDVIENAHVSDVLAGEGGEGVALILAGRDVPVRGSHLLVAAGRKPQLEGLYLEAGGIAFGPQGITVDDRLRSTTNRRVFALGEAVGAFFAHQGAHQAEIVLRNALFRQGARYAPQRVPRIVNTDPEMATVGCSEAEARRAARHIAIYRWPIGETDRARIAGGLPGRVKVIAGDKGRILGVSIVGRNAAELIAPWTLAMAEGLAVDALARGVAPSMTLTEASRRTALLPLAQTLRGTRARFMLRLVRWLG